MNRRVNASVWDRETKKFVDIYGVFHCWGIAYDEFESGPGNRTIAIVEKDDGVIVTVNPEDVRFLKGE